MFRPNGLSAEELEAEVDDELGALGAARAPSPQPDPPKKTGRAAFFASLHAAESEKAPVGTFHATGKFKEELEAENDRSGDWACTKCHYTNFKECLTCARCRSLRRFEGRNQASGYCQ